MTYFTDDYLHHIASMQFEFHRDAALALDVTFPRHIEDLAAYRETERARSEMIDDYRDSEDDPNIQQQIDFQEDNRNNLIKMKAVFDAFGEDNPHFRKIFVKSYTHFSLKFLTDDIVRSQYASSPDLRKNLPDRRDDLGPRTLKLIDNFHEMHDLLRSPDNLERTLEQNPVVTLYYNFRDTTKLGLYLRDTGQKAAVTDFRSGALNLYGVTTSLVS